MEGKSSEEYDGLNEMFVGRKLTKLQAIFLCTPMRGGKDTCTTNKMFLFNLKSDVTAGREIRLKRD